MNDRVDPNRRIDNLEFALTHIQNDFDALNEAILLLRKNSIVSKSSLPNCRNSSKNLMIPNRRAA